MRPDDVLLVVYRPGLEFLVLLRSPDRHGYWHLVAGGVVSGEAPTDAALRELAEETGLEDRVVVSALALELGHRRPDGSWVTVHSFVVEARAGWEPTLDEEHVEYRWCPSADALELLAYPEPREAVAEFARRLEDAA